MTCGSCTSSVTRALVAIDGVHDVKVTLSAAKVASEINVQYDEQFTSPDNLKLAVKEAGFGIEADNLAQKFQTKRVVAINACWLRLGCESNECQ